MFKFFCVRCNQKLSVEDSFIGKVVQCPKCETYMQVPERSKIIKDKNKVKKTSVNADEKKSFNQKLLFILIFAIFICIGVGAGVFLYLNAELKLRIAEKEKYEKEVVMLKNLSLCIENKDKVQNFMIIENIKVYDYSKYDSLNKTLNQYIFLLALTQNNVEEIDIFMKGIPEEDYELLKQRLVKQCGRCNKGYRKCNHCKDTKVCPSCKGRGGYYVEKVSGGRRYVACNPVCAECAKAEKCVYCKGNAMFINKKEVPDYLRQYRLSILQKIETVISEIEKQPENI